MSTINHVLVPTTGKNPTKFVTHSAFTKETGYKLFKVVAEGFIMSGKIRDFICANKIACHYVDSNFNGYGYSDHDYYYLLSRKNGKILLEMLEERELKREKNRKTADEKKSAWCRRLVKLTGISYDMALIVADDKLDAQRDSIEELEDRQYNLRYSVKREKLINKKYRENPLRRIEDEEHARRILQAYVRHNYSDYESQLRKARKQADWRIIPYSEIKLVARENTSYRSDLKSVFFPDKKEKEEEI